MSDKAGIVVSPSHHHREVTKPNPMSTPRPTADDFLKIGPKVRVLPIIHGSGDFAIRAGAEQMDRNRHRFMTK